MITACRVLSAVAGALCITTTLASGSSPFLGDSSDGIQVRAADGTLLWRSRPAERLSADFIRRDDGLILTADGLLVGPDGRLLVRWHGGADGRGGGGRPTICPYWDPPAEITPPPGAGISDSHAPPLVDSDGNVWVVLTHIASGDYSLQVRRSIGHSGAWEPLETLSGSTNYVSQPEGAIDGDDNITIAFRDIDAGYRLYAMRYEPGSGWGPLVQAYSTSTFFQAIEIAADEDGNVVVIFDPGLTAASVWSICYDNAAGAWGAPVQISTPGQDTLLPTLSQNENGSALYAVYLGRSGVAPGLYGHRWDAASRTWEPAQFLPGSENASFSFAGPVSRFPLVVGEDGQAAVLWQSAVEIQPEVFEFTVYASRTDGGVWQPAHELLPPGPWDTDIENFAHADTGRDADVMGVITRYESGSNRFWAFRHDDAGWRDPANPFTSTLPVSTRVRAVFYHGARAMASFYGPQLAQNQLTSMRYTGTGWLADLVDIPGDFIAWYQDPIADRSEALLVFEAEAGGNQGIQGSWLRNLVGDVNCDGVVDVPDLLEVLSAWGPCPPAPPDCPADIDGDGVVDVLDLLTLLAGWS